MVNLGPTLLMSQQITSHPGLGDWRLFIEKKKKKIEEEKQCSGILGFGVLSLRQLCSRQKEIFHGAENMSSTFRR